MNLQLNKLTPPWISEELHFSRQRLMHKLKTLKRSEKKIIIIEAQAGQGKSTLVAQYLNELKSPFTWYQIEDEDNGELLFFQNLYRGITNSFNGFHSDLLADMIEKNEINSGDYALYSKILLDELAAFVKGPHYMIFDDLYLLEKDSQTALIIGDLINSGLKDLHFILISRSPVEHILPGEILSKCSTIFSDDDLAMTKSEIASFFSEMTDIPVSGDLINQIYTITEGWTMGVLTKAHGIADSGNLNPVFPGKISENKNLKFYFKSEVLKHLPEETIADLAKLSFLASVPVELAASLTDNQMMPCMLNNLISKNYFTRYTSGDRSEVVFHHLFQECLREYAAEKLNNTEISKIFESAARWYLKKNQPEKGVVYFIRAKNYKAADQAVRDFGVELYAKNSVAVLFKALKEVPDEVLLAYSWLSYFFGLAIVDQNPPYALKYFKQAEEIFTKENDRIGILLACSQLIHFHVWVDSMFNEGAKYLPTVESLYNELAKSLPVQVRINSLYCLTCGYTVFESDFPRAKQYSIKALSLSMDNGFDNFTTMIRIMQCYQYAFTGDLEGFAKELEILSKMTASRRISSHNLLLVKMARLLFLEMKGDFLNYRILRDHLKKTTENNLVVKSILSPFIMLWDIDMALAKENYKTARELVIKALALPDAGKAPHFRSQFLHYKACTDALLGNIEDAQKATKESIICRNEAGSPFFIMHTDLITGGAMAAAGQTAKAEKLLKKAMAAAETIGANYEFTAALANSIGLQMDKDQHDIKGIETFIKLIEENSYVYLLTLAPSLFRKILKTAFVHNIKRKFVKDLAIERLDISFTENGVIIPLLKIKTLGEFSIEKEGKIILTAKDFTAGQLKLLAMLISSRHGYLTVEDIQAGFWPEKSTAKGRASFDTMISRLRKVLKEALSPHPVSSYFNLKKEQLYFKHAQIDVNNFIKSAEKALKYYSGKQFWQAENEFRRAFHFFKGDEFLPGIVLDQQSHRFKEYLLQPLFNECTKSWSSIMLSSPDYIPADTDTLEKMIGADSSNVELVKNIYHLRCHNNSRIMAQGLIRKYRETLRLEGFFADEINEIVESIWDN